MGLVSKGTKGPYVSGFQGIEGFPMLPRAFKGFDVFKIQRFQGLRDEGFQGSKVEGLKGERAPGFHRSKGLKVQGPKGPFQKVSWGGSRTSHINVSTLILTSEYHPVLLEQCFIT